MTRDQAKSREKLIAELTEMRRQIRTYRTHILEKMKMKNNAEITLYAVQNKLVG